MADYSSMESKLNNCEKPEKKSVAVDATPSGRGGSVLRQEPIEITKAKMDYGFLKDIIICQEVDMDPVLEAAPIRFDGEYQRIADPPISGSFTHKHSSSDPPLPAMYYNPDEAITSFMDAAPHDINVTSRSSIEREPLSPEESLLGIQRRNFPKVLPDYPPDDEDDRDISLKRRSLPPQYFLMHAPYFRYPPAPPPRISSTLERRRPSNNNNNTSTFTSAIKIVQSSEEAPPIPPDPEISVTELHVGALKSGAHNTEPIYLAMRRMNSIQENSTPSTSNHSIESEAAENIEIPEPDEEEEQAKDCSRSYFIRQMSNTSDESETSAETVKQITSRRDDE